MVNATDVPNLTNVTNMNGMFFNATSLGGGTGNWTWNTGGILTMEQVFHGAINFNQDIGTWDTSNVTSMNKMFRNAAMFNQDIGSWNVSNVSQMSSMFDMFETASAFRQNIGSWNVGNVTDMSFGWMGA